MATISVESELVQLGDIGVGQWFNRQAGPMSGPWIMSDEGDSLYREGYSLCMYANTGKIRYLDNSDRVYPMRRPNFA